MQRSTSTTSVIGYGNDAAMDTDICQMFGSLSLKAWSEGEPSMPKVIAPVTDVQPQTVVPSGRDDDAPMVEMIDAEGNVQFVSEPQLGCALMHSLRDFCIHPPSASSPPAPSRSLDFLDTILTHREAFISFPRAHSGCSQALTQLAFALERRHRAASAPTDGDLDHAIALHNEAWLMSGWTRIY